VTPVRTSFSVLRPRKSRVLTAVMALYLVYTLLPLLWLVINMTKTQPALLSTPGLSFGGPFALFDNIGETFTYDNGIFFRWLGNTLLYVVVGAGGATVLATAAGYGLAKYRFPGRRAVFAVVLGAIAIPGTALAVPTFLLFSKLGLTNTPLAIIIPSLISPFGLYLIWVYASEAIPDELLEAARIDGANWSPGSSRSRCSRWCPLGTTTSSR
jgi:multiple sugar transport system permease protein